MSQDERLLHSSTFGAAATAYAEHLPDYAQAAVDWALEPAPGPRVLDLGAGTGKLSSEDPRAHFGLGDATRIERLVVRYPNGRTTTLRNITADRILVIGKNR